MANIGEITEIINATKVHLDLGSDRYILLQELKFHVGRSESRESTGSSSVYFYGQHDNYFTATILLSSPEIATYLNYTLLDANGALPSNSFKLLYTDVSGTSKTVTVDSVVNELDIEKPMEGGTKTNLRFRITEEVSSADVT